MAHAPADASAPRDAGGGKRAARVFVWGWGRLAQFREPLRQNDPTLVETLEAASLRGLATGARHTVATTSNGTVYVWGPWSPSNQSAPSSAPSKGKESQMFETVRGFSGREVVVTACGRRDLFAVESNGKLYRWDLEQGSEQQDTDGPRCIPLGSYSISRIACGGGFAVAITNTGKVLSWGKGSHGRLGLGHTHDVSTPSLLSSLADLVVSRVSCGWSHSAVVTSTGMVYTWGCSLHGRLGLGSSGGRAQQQHEDAHEGERWHSRMHVDVGLPTRVEDGCFAPGHVHRFRHYPYQRDSSSRPQHPKPEVRHEPVIVDVACGYHHTVVLDAAGSVYSWGGGELGQLGLGEPVMIQVPSVVSASFGRSSAGSLVSPSTPRSSSANHGEGFYAPASSICSLVWTWAHDGTHSLTSGSGTTPHQEQLCVWHPTLLESLVGQHIVSVACGAFHSAAINTLGELFMWGWNEYGQLGIGEEEGSQWAPRLVEALLGMDVTHVCCGGEFTVAATGHFMNVQNDYFMSNGDQPPGPSVGAPKGLSLAKASADGNNSSDGDRGNSMDQAAAGVVDSDGDAEGGRQHSPRSTIPNVFSEGRTAVMSQTSIEDGEDGQGPARNAANSVSTSLSVSLHATTESEADGQSSSSSGPARRRAKNSLLSFMFSRFSKDKEKSDQEEQDAGLSDPAQTDPRTYRPANLPPKSSTEASKHKKEVSRMHDMYRSKLLKEAKAKELRKRKELVRQEEERKVRERETRRQVERETRLDEATSEWLNNIVPNWESKRYAARAHDMVWKVGIPPQVRCKVWPLAIGNSLMITRELFDIFSSHAKQAREMRLRVEAEEAAVEEKDDDDKGGGGGGGGQKEKPNRRPLGTISPNAFIIPGPGKEVTFSYIDVDLTRTFPSLAFFQEDCSMNDQLRNVLETFCFYRPDIGYVQGMSYIAGNLLLYMDAYTAFVCFANLLNAPFFHAFLKLNPQEMQARYEIFNLLFKDQLSKLYKHFEGESLSPDLYFMEWCMTLFCKRLTLEVVGRVWDCYFIFGEAVVFRVAVGILKILEKQLMGESFESCMKILQSETHGITEEQLFDALGSIKLTQACREKLRALTARSRHA